MTSRSLRRAAKCRPAFTLVRSATIPMGLATLVVLAVVGVVVAALPQVPVPAQNPITEPKRALGKVLFWDEQLSTSNAMSCGTCHTPNRGGTDARVAQHPGADNALNTADDVSGSPGIIRSAADNDFVRDVIFALAPQVTNRSANSPIMAAYAPSLFWDGRAAGQFIDPETGLTVIPTGGALESQAIGPPLSTVEMAHADFDWTDLTSKLARIQPLALSTNIPSDVALVLTGKPGYADLFREAFGDEQITAARIAMAIATYQRTLISNQTPFDRFRAGQANALSAQQQRGLTAFQNATCIACHAINNDLFTDHTFRNLALRPNAQDLGLQLTTGNVNDRGKFKTPGLRNVGLKRTFMHTGQFTTLQDVMAFYAAAPGINPRPDNRDGAMNNPALTVPPPVANDIIEFMRNGLLDQRVANQTFPFDKPTLFVDRPADQATLLGGAVAGTGGVVPIMIAQAPPMIGNLEYRLGVDVSPALIGGIARLAVSSAAPVNGRVVPQELLGPVVIESGSASGGTGAQATLHWPVRVGEKLDGQTVFVQWQIPDSGAAGGEARSAAARIEFFCGSMGCPTSAECATDFNRSTVIDLADLLDYFDRWTGQSGRTGAGWTTDTNADRSVDLADLLEFYDNWSQNNGGACN